MSVLGLEVALYVLAAVGCTSVFSMAMSLRDILGELQRIQEPCGQCFRRTE